MKCKVKVCQKVMEREKAKVLLIFGFAFLSIISECQSAPSPSDEVVFYEDPQFDGDRLYLSLGKGCYTMEKDWDNRISSVNPNENCVMGFEKEDCRGRSVKLTQGSKGLEDFTQLQFDNLLSSISICSRSNGGIGATSESNKHDNMDEPEIWRVGIEEHNRYRRMHGVPALKGDRQLHEDAQAHADYLAKNNKFELSPGTKYGENLATSYKKDKLDALREVIKRWYDKIEFYNFRNPEANRDMPKSAQFSSVVWKSTSHVGIGVARNNQENKWVVVVFYDPAATRTKYRENVPPPTRQVHVQEPTLFRTSALGNFFNSRSRYDSFV